MHEFVNSSVFSEYINNGRPPFDKIFRILKYCRKFPVTNRTAFSGIFQRRGQPCARNTEISYQEFPLRLIFLAEFSVYFDNFRIFQKLSQQLFVPFQVPVSKFCGIFGRMESARRSHSFYHQQLLAVVSGKCQKSISLGGYVTLI